jgi:3-hydroxyisobutyrate dehydrogenase-like beta-hydroxyacid dehydrogenase
MATAAPPPTTPRAGATPARLARAQAALHREGAWNVDVVFRFKSGATLTAQVGADDRVEDVREALLMAAGRSAFSCDIGLVNGQTAQHYCQPWDTPFSGLNPGAAAAEINVIVGAVDTAYYRDLADRRRGHED